MNKRQLSLEKYGISGKRYKELCGFCEQYPEWKKELKYNNSTLKSMEVTGMPLYNTNSDPVARVAEKMCDIESKCNLIERTAKEASSEIWEYIIKSVCYEVPVNYLIACEEMPFSRSVFYEYRRLFFYLLDKNKKN